MVEGIIENKVYIKILLFCISNRANYKGFSFELNAIIGNATLAEKAQVTKLMVEKIL